MANSVTHWLARLLSFKRPLLSVNVSVCLSATLMLNSWESTRFRGSCPLGVYRKVPFGDDIVTSQYSKSSHSETVIRVDCGPFKQTLKDNVVFALQLPEKKYFSRPHSDRNSSLFHNESSPYTESKA